MSYHRIKKELVETFSLNNAKAFDRFIDDKIYKLLGKDTNAPEIRGCDIQNAVKDIKSDDIWFIYIAPFLIDSEVINLPLTRAEKRILEWTKKLKTQKATNNTPVESIILNGVLGNA